jgi:hypothetical protein
MAGHPRVARVCVHDDVVGHSVGDVLEGYAAISPNAIRHFVDERVA